MVNSPIPKIAAGIADMGGAGLPEAEYMYGRMLVEGRECDLKAARAWFTRAADSDMAEARDRGVCVRGAWRHLAP